VSVDRAVAIFRERPDIFAEHAFELGHFKKQKIDLWSKQRELLQSVARHDRVTVRSGHKTGKSFSAGILAWWWFCTHADARVIMIAPSNKQLNQILWTEVKRLGNSMVFSHGAQVYEQVHNGVSSHDGRRIFGFTGNTKPENMAGFSGNILSVCDEASGLSDSVHEVVDTVPNGSVLCISNPTIPHGAFYNQHQHGSSWHKVHLSSVEAAAENTWSGNRWKYEHLANNRWVDKMRADYKEGSYYWSVRVLGEFPTITTDTVVSDAVVRDSWSREVETGAGDDVHLGVDVARYKRENNVEIARRVAIEIDKHLYRDQDARVHVKIDCSNGGGVADILDEKYGSKSRVNIVQVLYQERATSPHYERKRDQLWFEMAAWLESARTPKNDDLRAELIAPKYKYSPGGKRVVESKQELKKRIHRSPDMADAVALAVYSEDRGESFYEEIEDFARKLS
jgi:hypothetical protein